MNERTMVVVADGGGVRVFVEGHRGGPLQEQTDALDLPRLHAAGASQPGRVFDRFGQGSHGIGREAPHDKAEREFMEDLAKQLPGFAKTCEADNIVIMAAPRALGVLREALPAAGQQLLRETEPKDRLDATPEDLRVALRELRRESA